MADTVEALVDVLDLLPGDELRVGGEWLEVTEVDAYRRDFRVLVRTTGPDEHGRTFLAEPDARRLARRPATRGHG